VTGNPSFKKKNEGEFVFFSRGLILGLILGRVSGCVSVGCRGVSRAYIYNENGVVVWVCILAPGRECNFRASLAYPNKPR